MKFVLMILFAFMCLRNVYSQDTSMPAPNPKITFVHADTTHITGKSEVKEIRAIRIETHLNIDGILNEPEWALAAPSPHFIQIDPEQGKPAHFDTKIKLLYNQAYLYVGII